MIQAFAPTRGWTENGRVPAARLVHLGLSFSENNLIFDVRVGVAIDESVKMRMKGAVSVWKSNRIKDLRGGAYGME